VNVGFDAHKGYLVCKWCHRARALCPRCRRGSQGEGGTGCSTCSPRTRTMREPARAPVWPRRRLAGALTSAARAPALVPTMGLTK